MARMPDVQLGLEDESPEYRAFVEKFKPKKTTDDCITPGPVYDAVLAWAAEEYGFDPAMAVRPFWPGADYEKFDYPDGCVVVDNPPFSIMSRIVRDYFDAGIRFFLFAPHLTNFSIARKLPVCHLTVGANVTYENGAAVNTSFVTNLDDAAVYAPASLREAVDEASRRNLEASKAPAPPRYGYPPEVLTAAMCDKITKNGGTLRISRGDAAFVAVLDAQRAAGKAVFGGGFLLSKKAAAEKAATEKAATEKAVEWPLSDRERAIVRMLGDGDAREMAGGGSPPERRE